MNSLSITFQSGLIAIYILLGLGALIVSWWSYRNLVPQISQVKRALLVMLRSLGIFFIALLLIEPLLTKFSEKTIGDKLGIVYDLSSSMQISDDGVARFAMAENARPVLENIRAGIKYYGFSDSLVELKHLPDSSMINGRATDLAVAINEPFTIAEDELGALLVITDGTGNIGLNPLSAAMAVELPVYSLVVGKTVSYNDISISSVNYPPVSYINTEISITAEVKSSGYEGKNALIEIKDDERTVASKRVTLPADGAYISVDLPVTFKTEGVHALKAVLGSPGDETYTDNNKRNFSIKLLKDKTSILILSSSVNWEYTFLKRALDSDPYFKTESAIMANNNIIPGGDLPANQDAWQQVDLVIALDIPSRALGSRVNELKAAIESGTGLLFIAGDRSRLTPLGGWDDVLPLAINARTSFEQGEFFPMPGEQAVVKAVTDIEDLNWVDLSPLEFLFTGFDIESNSIVFLDVIDGANEHHPVLVGGAYKTGKTAAIVGYPWWTRSFRPQTGETSPTGMVKFWGNLVRWLIAREDMDKFNLVSDKTVYRLGEPIKFSSVLFNDSYNLQSGAQINIEIADSTGSIREFKLSSSQSGRYSGTYGSPAAGEYAFTGYAIWENDTVGVAKGQFMVESFGLEMENPSANFSLMQQIASVSGGKSYTVDNFTEFENDLELNTSTADVFEEYSPTGNIYILILVILLFSLEWGIRKFSQLA